MINQIKTILLLGILTGLLLGIGQFFGGAQGLAVALVFVGLMNFFTYWFSHKFVLMMYRAHEAKKTEHPELHKIVEEVSHQTGIPTPKLYIIPSANPNAFATGRNPKNGVVACTEGIMKLLSKDELKGVLAHEMAHIKNRDILVTTIAATIAGVISYLARIAQFAAIFGGGRDDEGRGNVLSLLLLAVLTPIIAMILQLAISRSREYLADETGARAIKNPKALASALKKLAYGSHHAPMEFGSEATSSLFIVNPFASSGFFALMSTHPPMEERIKRLNDMKV